MRLSELPYYERWFVAGALIGAVIGLAALSLYYLQYALFSQLVMRDLLHVNVNGMTQAQYEADLGWLVLMPAVLAAAYPISLLVAMALRTPEVGSDVPVRAYHRNLRLRPEDAAAPILSSAVTVGLGGSAGLESPAAHAGAALGQLITRWLNMTAEDRRRALAIGLGAGIGAVFKSPFAGAILSAELLYRRDVEVDVLYPSFIASSVAYAVYGAATGYSPIMGFYLGPFRPLYLPLMIPLGLLAAGVGMLYARAIAGVASALRPLGSPFLRAAVGGLAVGAIAIAFPEVMGEGFGWVRMAIAGQAVGLLPLYALIALLPLAKLLATSLTLGSGAKGGVFAPGLDIGAFTGLAYGLLLHALAPDVVKDAAPFVIVGMLSTFGAASSAPISSMLMTIEMTGSLTLLPGEMIALAVAMLAYRGPTLLREQVETRADSPVHASEVVATVLRRVRVSEVELRQLYVRHDARASEALQAVSSSGLLSLPVIDSVRRVLGVVRLVDLRAASPDDPVIRYLRPEPGHVRPDSTLEEALNLMSRTGARYAIVEDNGVFHGVVLDEDVRRAFEREALRELMGYGRAEG